MKAYVVCLYVKGYCKATFTNPEQMESTALDGSFLDCFHHIGMGSHKYIPTEKLNADLKLPNGAGVYGYVKMYDGTYVLLTCDGPLAYWSGKTEDEAKWPSPPTKLI